jgi:hypothetical protein
MVFDYPFTGRSAEIAGSGSAGLHLVRVKDLIWGLFGRRRGAPQAKTDRTRGHRPRVRSVFYWYPRTSC